MGDGRRTQGEFRMLRVQQVQGLDNQVIGRDRASLVRLDKLFNHGFGSFLMRSTNSSARSQA